jgi:hypothetical protein
MPPDPSSPDHAEAAAEFATLIAACLRRFLAQNEKPALPETELAALAARFRSAVLREASLVTAAEREWKEMPVELVEKLALEVLGDAMTPARGADLGVPVRQLLKACLQAEPVRCRESYREVVAGRCRRQELARTRGRISGAHCVDCPHWVSLDAGENLALMERAWVEGPIMALQAHRDIFLPEDFRALRTWARRGRIRPV